MKQIILLLTFLIFHFTGKTQCLVYEGNLTTVVNNNKHSFYLDKLPNFCHYIPDTSYLLYSITCKESMITEKITTSLTDTLNLDITGETIVSTSVKALINNRIFTLSFGSKCYKQDINGCYSIVPEISTENPPPGDNEIRIVIENGYVNSSVSGNLIVLNYPNFTPQYIFNYDIPFSYLIPNGTYYIYVILSDGNIYDLGVVIN
mgnify:FL=1